MPSKFCYECDQENNEHDQLCGKAIHFRFSDLSIACAPDSSLYGRVTRIKTDTTCGACKRILEGLK